MSRKLSVHSLQIHFQTLQIHSAHLQQKIVGTLTSTATQKLSPQSQQQRGVLKVRLGRHRFSSAKVTFDPIIDSSQPLLLLRRLKSS